MERTRHSKTLYDADTVWIVFVDGEPNRVFPNHAEAFVERMRMQSVFPEKKYELKVANFWAKAP